MGQFSHDVFSLVHAITPRAAAEQGGILSGDNPSHYSASNPLRLWVIQVIIIIGMTQLLSLALARIRQPRVIAEVIGGVILGPTVMGRIPHFKDTVFPDAGMPMLALTSTIGLVLFLFLVGLEIDMNVVKRNVKASSLISIAGLVVPLGLGSALGVGVYREFINPSVNEGYFILFTAVAVGITAFPVLCRILTELKLLDTNVGVVTLSAGVGNDVIGWILLALTVALVNASTGLTALWVLLVCVGYVLFLLYPVKWGFVWLAKRTGSLEQGSPTPFMMTITLLVIFISAFFTDIIGVHAIFGGFLAGLIIPKENGFAISLVEKLEDLVSILLLPIYFTLSGLRTNLGLLDNGVTWGYTIIICLVAFVSKFVACGSTALLTGFNWREAGAIGSLMSCKGLVELIVLNIGLQAGILDTRVFSMFVVHALILTFITTPLTLLFYPSKHRTREGHALARDTAHHDPEGSHAPLSAVEGLKTRFSLVLDRMEQLPSAMILAQLLQPVSQSTKPILSHTSETEKDSLATKASDSPRITVDALRLIELTNRTSAVLKSQAAESLLLTDPIVSIFRTFGHINRILVSAALSVVGFEEFSAVVANHVRESESQMVLIPWRSAVSGASPEPTVNDTEATKLAQPTLNPFDGLFHRTSSVNPKDQTSSVVYSEFIRNVFMHSPVDVGLFVDRGILSGSPVRNSSEHHLFVPFFGGPDDRLALTFVVQLCTSNPAINATVVRIQKVESNDLTPASTDGIDEKAIAAHHRTPQTTYLGPDTVYGNQDTHTRLASDTADNITWEKYSGQNTDKDLISVLSRIEFRTHQSSQPLKAVIDLVNTEHAKLAGRKTLLAVIGRSRRMAVESLTAELRAIMDSSANAISSAVPKTLGDVGAGLVAAGTNASFLIMQAKMA